jgi:tellurite resistance protein TerC
MDVAWLWIVFGVVIVGMLVLDLLVLRRRPVAMPFRTAVMWSAVWISLAVLFGALIWLEQGAEKGLEFAAGYIIEWSLSVDNLFVFLLIFGYFAVPRVYQHRVLFWGIMGAVAMRAAFIAAGVTLLAWFHWMFYVFGAFLVITGIRMALSQEQNIDPEKNPVLRLFRRLMPVTAGYRGERFFVKEAGRWIATPLVPVLLLIETTDLIFAVDSVPAIFAITTDPFIVYTSNVFAILGLRSLFFVLAGVMGLFRYLRVGLAVVLVFVGAKMLIADVLHIPVGISLGVVASVLLLSVLLSIAIRRPAPAASAGESLERAADRARRRDESRAA